MGIYGNRHTNSERGKRKIFAYECSRCGEIFAELYRDYVTEWPDSSGKHLDELASKHRELECAETPDRQVRVVVL